MFRALLAARSALGHHHNIALRPCLAHASRSPSNHAFAPCWGVRAMASSTGADAIPQQEEFMGGSTSRLFDVAPGSTLKVTLPTIAANFTAYNGPLETVALRTTWDFAAPKGAQDPFAYSRAALDETGTAVVEVVAAPEVKTDGSNGYPAITAWVPERFCSVSLLTAGGDVSLSNMTEATLRLFTAGGNVALGSIKGAIAEIETGGGSVKAKVLSAGLVLRTAGGSVDVGRVVSDKASISLSGGAAKIDALYADVADVETGGGDFTVKAMRSSQRGVVRTAGGRAVVEGADGYLHVDSAGGGVEVQALEGVTELVVDSSGGDITLSISSGLTADIRAFGSGGVTVEEGGVTARGKHTFDELVGTVFGGLPSKKYGGAELSPSGEEDGGARFAAAMETAAAEAVMGGEGAGDIGRGVPHLSPTRAVIKVDAGSGKVVIKGKDWLGGFSGLAGLRR